ncbi:hypothetical protein THAOC_01821, partial [Thalassiosira oceanica]
SSARPSNWLWFYVVSRKGHAATHNISQDERCPELRILHLHHRTVWDDEVVTAESSPLVRGWVVAESASLIPVALLTMAAALLNRDRLLRVLAPAIPELLAWSCLLFNELAQEAGALLSSLSFSPLVKLALTPATPATRITTFHPSSRKEQTGQGLPARYLTRVAVAGVDGRRYHGQGWATALSNEDKVQQNQFSPGHLDIEGAMANEGQQVAASGVAGIVGNAGRALTFEYDVTARLGSLGSQTPFKALETGIRFATMGIRSHTILNSNAAAGHTGLMQLQDIQDWGPDVALPRVNLARAKKQLLRAATAFFLPPEMKPFGVKLGDGDRLLEALSKNAQFYNGGAFYLRNFPTAESPFGWNRPVQSRTKLRLVVPLEERASAGQGGYGPSQTRKSTDRNGKGQYMPFPHNCDEWYAKKQEKKSKKPRTDNVPPESGAEAETETKKRRLAAKSKLVSALTTTTNLDPEAIEAISAQASEIFSTE